MNDVTPPLPSMVSDAARAAMEALSQAPPRASSLARMRAEADSVQAEMARRQRKRHAVTIGDEFVAGVPVRVFKPSAPSAGAAERLLINFHGGGFHVDSGSLSENIPICALTGLNIVSGLYRMAPEHPFPAAVDDALAIYQDALERHDPKRIAVFGTSAGGILTAQLMARLQRLGLPMPAAAGYFSMSADFAHDGDSEQFFPLPGGRSVATGMASYTGAAKADDPLVSPIFDDLARYPKSLLIAGTRDVLLSHTVRFHLAQIRAGVDARLVVFEAMPHAHWAYIEAPESDEAFAIMARFFDAALA
jgi:monoterpene epsilon-lactone hydrolase